MSPTTSLSVLTAGIANLCKRTVFVTLPMFIIFELIDLVSSANASGAVNGSTAHSLASSDNKSCTVVIAKCKEGLLLPMWRPQGNLSTGDKAARATVYMAAMIYMFLGVSIIADRFMVDTEVITSKEKL